jgi:hypothetical protein
LNRARALDFYGKIISLFLLSVVMTMYSGFKNIAQMKNTPTITLDLFTYILPFIGFIVDAAVKRAYYISAKNIFVVGKVALVLYYLAIYVLAL